MGGDGTSVLLSVRESESPDLGGFVGRTETILAETMLADLRARAARGMSAQVHGLRHQESTTKKHGANGRVVVIIITITMITIKLAITITITITIIMITNREVCGKARGGGPLKVRVPLAALTLLGPERRASTNDIHNQ